MANPRQRRKLRSGSHKPVRHSLRAKRNQRKQPPIKGPKVLQDAWDKHKTVRQNYESLGLIASLNPTASGGFEKPLGTHPLEHEERPDAGHAPAGVLRKGFGRIIRDEDGDVVDVEMAEEEDEGGEIDEQEGWTSLGSRAGSSTRVVQRLEGLKPVAVARFCSTGEDRILRRLVGKYHHDVDGMARDRKLNPDQRTSGELRRAIKKAGGFDAFVY